jgi:hypothetical protein
MNSLPALSGNNNPLIPGKANVANPMPPLFRSPSKSPSLILANMDFFKIFPEEELRCPRSKQIFKNPMILPCGDSFDQESLDDWEKNNLKICPQCSKPYEKRMEYIFLKTVLQRINEKISFAQSQEPSVEDLYKELLEIPEKAQVKLGIDQYRLGNTTEGAKFFTEALMSVQDIALSKQIVKILNKLNTSVPAPEKKMDLFSTPVNCNEGPPVVLPPTTITESVNAPFIRDEYPPVVPPPTVDSGNNKPDPQVNESRKRPLEGTEPNQNPAKRPKLMIKIHKPKPITEEPRDNPAPIDALLVEEEIVTEVIEEEQPTEKNGLLNMMKNKVPYNDVIVEIDEYNANSCDQNGNTPLHLLPKYYQISNAIWNKLMECKANIHQPNHKGNTPLHAAAKFNRITLIKELRHRGVDPNVKNNNGELPVDLATSKAAKDWINRDLTIQ